MEIKVSTKWPDYLHPLAGPDVPPDLIGSEILAIGEPISDVRFEGGGLAIEYRPANSSEKKMIVLEFTEVAMWVAYMS